MAQDIALGTQFIRSRGKHNNNQVETVVDILKTYNTAGELVRTRYAASHDFLGQTVIDTDIVSTTILKGAL
tara:strand:+ start:215 stop:427 length:213 start_codon:yes stop_codon:yes gene_type:complete